MYSFSHEIFSKVCARVSGTYFFVPRVYISKKLSIALQSSEIPWAPLILKIRARCGRSICFDTMCLVVVSYNTVYESPAELITFLLYLFFIEWLLEPCTRVIAYDFFCCANMLDPTRSWYDVLSISRGCLSWVLSVGCILSFLWVWGPDGPVQVQPRGSVANTILLSNV
jgi:hypothetical protein